MAKKIKENWKVIVQILPYSYSKNQWFTFDNWYEARQLYRNNADFREYADMRLRTNK
jgi:hypothetical protein